MTKLEHLKQKHDTPIRELAEAAGMPVNDFYEMSLRDIDALSQPAEASEKAIDRVGECNRALREMVLLAKPLLEDGPCSIVVDRDDAIIVDIRRMVQDQEKEIANLERQLEARQQKESKPMEYTIETLYYDNAPAKIALSFKMDVIVWDPLHISEQQAALKKLLDELETKVAKLTLSRGE